MPARAAARRLSYLAIGMLLGAMIGGCYAEPVAIATWPPTEPPASTVGSLLPASPEPTQSVEATLDQTATPLPTPESTPEPTLTGQVGPPSADCINGWIAPAAGSAEYADAIALLDTAMGTSGEWDVFAMRYFSGPDAGVDPAIEARYWYVRAALVDDPLYGGRWLLRYRDESDKGVAAVAPLDSESFFSPDWTAFSGDGGPTTYLGLPGQWTGTPYDFVTGVGGTGQPGLSAEVVGCMSAT